MEQRTKSNYINNILVDKRLPWIIRALFFGFCFIILCVVYKDVLYQFFWRNYFIDNPVFAEETVNQSAGWMKYIGRYLNQLFYHPWLVSLLISVILSSIQLMVQWLFDKQQKYVPLTYLPSVLLLMLFLSVNYSIFAVFEMGFYFATLVGTLYTFIQYSLYHRIKISKGEMTAKSYWMRASLFLLVEILLYPYIGIFAILPMLMVALDEVLQQQKWMLVIQIVLFFLLPYFCIQFNYNERYWHVLFSPLSDPYFKDLLIINVSFMLSLLLMIWMKHRTKGLPKIGTVVVILAEVAIISYGIMNKTSQQFRHEMKLARLVDKKDWKSVLKNISTNNQITHTENAFRVVALANTNQLKEHLFEMKMPFLPNPSDVSSDMIIYYNDLFLYGSFLSVARQLNMEQWVTIGENYRGLRYFIELAIIMDDDELAKRYIDILKQTLFLRDAADKYEAYLKNKKAFYADYPDYARVKINFMKEDRILSAHSFFAKNYLKFNYLDGDNIERRLLAELYMKNLDHFVKYFTLLAKRYPNVPQYMQESLILYALMKNDPSYLKIAPIDQQLFYMVKSLVDEVSRCNKVQMEAASERLYKKYKNTYAYYYVFNTEDYINYSLK